MTNAHDLARSLAWHRQRDAVAAQDAAETTYAQGRLDGAMRAHAAVVRLVAATAGRDHAVVRRNQVLLAAVGA